MSRKGYVQLVCLAEDRLHGFSLIVFVAISMEAQRAGSVVVESVHLFSENGCYSIGKRSNASVP